MINEKISKIREIVESSKKYLVKSINKTMIKTYFDVGKIIVEEKLHGQDRAEYGNNTIINISQVLTEEFGKGFSVTNLKQMVKFYQVYSEKGQTVSDEFMLSWSHYLIRLCIRR